MPLIRRFAAAIFVPLAALAALPVQAAPKQPNILMILADDLGINDTGIYGSAVIKTPNIDRLARMGVKFNNAYVSHPVCAPSRAGMLTGRAQTRFGYEFNPVGRDMATGMSLNERTIGNYLQAAGYRTAVIGKWHSGGAPGYRPHERGFDYFYGITSGAGTFLTRLSPGDEAVRSLALDETVVTSATPEDRAILAKESDQAFLDRMRKGVPVRRNGDIVTDNGYFTESLTAETLKFIDASKDKPFFIHLAHTAPHTPLQATRKYIERYAHIEDKATRVYAAMVSAVDDSVGEIIGHLEKTGRLDDTLIIFLSDNGCASYVGKACSNAPLSGFKATHLEGGIRVPFLVAWPGHIQGGRTENQMVSALDILPTALAIGRAEAPAGLALDGTDLLPLLLDAKTALPPRDLFWRAGVNFAVRSGDWKMWVANIAPPPPNDGRSARWVPDGVEAKISPLGQHIMLYNLKTDPAEKQNVAAQNPDVVAKLQAMIKSWDQGMVRPQWTSQRQSRFEWDGVTLEMFN